jgi:Mg-chelatase subunit ChlD
MFISRRFMWIFILILSLGALVSCFGGDDDDDDSADTIGDDDDAGGDDDGGDDDGGDDDGWDDDGGDDDADDDGWDDDVDDDVDDDWWDDDWDDDTIDDDIDDDSIDDDTTEEPVWECPLEQEPLVLWLSADDSNSQASPVISRFYIESGSIVPRGRVRTYEFTNYYQIEYEAPVPGRIKIVPQLREMENSEYEAGREYVLQIGAQSHRIDAGEGRHVNLTFSLDTSGSMGDGAIDLLKDVCRAIATQLQDGDIVSMVEWSDSTSVPLDSHMVAGPNDPTLLDAIDDLSADGSTDLHGGLVRAYELAADNYQDGWLNRVVLISDGGANTGITDINIISQAADDSEGEGIYLIGVGVDSSPGDYRDELMDDVTDAGKGAYIFVGSKAEADTQFMERFQENMELAAMDVQVRLEMPWYMLMKEFHGEEYNPNPDEVEPQHLGPNDAMVFHQFIIACDGQTASGEDIIKVRAEYTDPFTRVEKQDQKTMTIAELLATDADQLLKGNAIVAYAEALKEIDRLIDEGYGQDALILCQTTKETVQNAAIALGDAELEEIAELLGDYESTVGSFVR